ncbi:MAG: helix-turn-helix transcriptional regulator, partial [Acetobacteraceae bacterium]|nr:helix-turn-helix transcriptional regulator [Acetobacteraceae bacterium]
MLCTCGPEDRPFEEQHEQACVAAVLAGTFQYRSARGAATLSPGSVLLGNDGTCFECRHAHGRGDRCVAFHFSPDYIRPVLRGHRVRRRGAFVASHVPPSTELVPVLAAIEAAARHADPAALEEAGLRLLSAALAVDTGQRAQAPTLREERQVSTVIRRIEREYGEELPLSALAQGVELSPFALLRSFRRVVGMTPHQYVLRTRLQRAAVRIAETTAPVSRIAYEAGFNDLS